MGMKKNEIAGACISLVRRGLATTLSPRDGETVYTNVNGAAAQAALAEGGGDDKSDRSIVVLRRGKVLSILEGTGVEPLPAVDVLWRVHDAGLEVLKGATFSAVQSDLVALERAKLAEHRSKEATGGFEGWILTMAGEKAVVDRGYAAVAQESIEREQAVEEPAVADSASESSAPTTQDADSSGATTWGDVAEASAEKDDANRPRRGKKKGDEPSPQLGLSDRPGCFTMELPCPVPAEDVERLQQEHLDACDNIDSIEEEKTSAMKRFRERLDAAEEAEREARSALRIARSGLRHRPVECEKRLDGSTMRIFRLDTGEKIDERAATAAELEATNPPPPTIPLPDGAEVREAAAEPAAAPAKPSPEEAVRAAFNGAPVGKAELLARVVGVAPNAAAQAFEALKSEGAILGEGKGRGTKYRLAPSGAESSTSPS